MKNTEKITEKYWKITVEIMITMTLVNIYFFNVDHDHVQTLGDFSIGIANSHLWSLITPYLDPVIFLFCSEQLSFIKGQLKIS